MQIKVDFIFGIDNFTTKIIKLIENFQHANVFVTLLINTLKKLTDYLSKFNIRSKSLCH